MEALDIVQTKVSTRHARLIGNDQQQVTAPAQLDQRLRHAGQQTQVLDAMDVAEVLIQDTVTVEKNGQP